MLIVMYPQHSHVMYLDSGSAKPKNFDDVKLVLNKALTGFAAKAGPLKHPRPSRDGFTCIHTTKFACIKQSNPENGMDGWFTLLQMREFKKDEDDLKLPASLQGRCINLAEAKPDRVRAEFRSIMREMASIIHNEICTAGGLFFHSHGMPTNHEIKSRLVGMRDKKQFRTLEGMKPFPPSHYE